MPTFYLILSTLALFIGLLITYWVHSRLGLEIVVEPVPPPQNAPLVSVIVPARDEARNIRRCVQALLDQSYPEIELIVVDDRSRDGTSAILANLQAKNSRLTVVPGEHLPPGWAGKPHALIQGVSVAQGTWLCFVDADTFASPELIASAYAATQAKQADLLTLLTEQELGSFWEKVVLPLIFTALSFGFPAHKVNDPLTPDAIANGQFILIKREVYQAVGGHTAVRARVDEDKALAEIVKRGGFRLVVADGRYLVRTRMYTSLPEIWEGFTKNIFLGLQDRLGLLTFGAAVAFLGALALPLWLLAGLFWIGAGGGLPAAIVTLEAILVWGYLIYKRIQAGRAFHLSTGYAFTLPLGAAIFAVMMFVSGFNVISGRGVTWKGRRYTRSSE
jgi:chlorobactene glucosyltransferase